MTGLVAGIGAKLAFGDLLSSFGRGLAAFADWVAKHWQFVLAVVVAIALGIYILNLKGEVRHWQKQDASDVAARKQAEQAAATNLASLKGALAQIQAANVRADAAAAELAAEKKQDAADVAAANARYKPTGAAVARLERSAGDKSLPPCKVSPEALKALGGL